MGQVSGEYWSQGAKVMGKAQDKPIITMMGLGGSVFLFRLLSLSFCLFIYRSISSWDSSGIR